MDQPTPDRADSAPDGFNLAQAGRLPADQTDNAFSLTQKLAAEALGTFFLLAAVVGSGIMGARLADGNTAIALLANTVSTGAILVVLIAMLGAVSGAHFNPAVTLHFWRQGDIGARRSLAYITTQILFGVLGVIAAHFMFAEPAVSAYPLPRSGWGQWSGEFIATFGLVATIIGTLRFRPDMVAVTVGLYITAAYWFTSSTSFANPAVTVARSFTHTFAGIRTADVPGFILAQLAGAMAASVIVTWLVGTKKA